MVELIEVPARRNLGAKPKIPSEMLAGKVIDYLRDHPQGETVYNLASDIDVSEVNVRKVLGIIASVTTKIAPFFMEHGGARVRLLLTRSPKGTVTAARFEAAAPEYEEDDLGPSPAPAQKPTYAMCPADVAEVQRVWKIYKATGRAFRREEATRLDALCERFPYLFTTNAAKTGILPTMALFTVAKTIEQYAALGRLPDAIETPVANITFDGGA